MDRNLLGSTTTNIQGNVVVAKDGNGDFKTVAYEPNNSETRYIIHVTEGIYNENVQIGSEKTNMMLMDDGMNATIITGSLNKVARASILMSPTVGVDGDGDMFIEKEETEHRLLGLSPIVENDRELRLVMGQEKSISQNKEVLRACEKMGLFESRQNRGGALSSGPI
ncbi:hypothetical protein VNO78_08809 [Psophocarpus tetragonolobus]|uniref:Pectinesterase catalytic domain-containing protein n=1 Tax=Psophocarpus tetragonolobus TaxID=3891 RepID=A0AAN9T6L4_PSOTE